MLSRRRETGAPCLLPPRSKRVNSLLARSPADSTSSMIMVGRMRAVNRYSDAGVRAEQCIARRQKQCKSRCSVVFPLPIGPQIDMREAKERRSANQVLRAKAATGSCVPLGVRRTFRSGSQSLEQLPNRSSSRPSWASAGPTPPSDPSSEELAVRLRLQGELSAEYFHPAKLRTKALRTDQYS